MRLTLSIIILGLSCQLVAAAPPQDPAFDRPAPPNVDITTPPQDTRLVVVDFKIVESSGGKDQALANPRVAVPIGETGEVSIGNTVPGAPAAADGKPAPDQFVGTKVQVTPVLRRDGKIQMTFKMRISQVVPGAAGNAQKIDVREATNTAVASPGQTVSVSAFKNGETETRITAMPRIMDAAAAMKGMSAPR